MGKGRIMLDIIGKKFNRLLVLEQVEDKIDKNSGKHKSQYLCLCDCGNYTIQLGTNIKNGIVKSCGCLHKEVASKTFSESKHRKKYNTYDLSNGYGIGYTLDGMPFYFDLEDYDKIKDICWYISDKGYVVGHLLKTNKSIKMHNLIIEHDKNSVIDHINTHMKNDNRKNNLRVITQQKNTMNRMKLSNNTSGTTGVSFDKRKNKWVAYISYNKKRIHLGYFVLKEDAIKARKEAEEHYFREYSYDNSMKISNNTKLIEGE